MHRKKIILLGIAIDNVRFLEAKNILLRFLSTNTQHFVTTLNPEILLAAGRDASYRTLLHYADLALPDGVGVRMASWMFGRESRLPETVTGVDIAGWLLDHAEMFRLRVTCIIRRDGRSRSETVERIVRARAPHAAVQVVPVSRDIATLETEHDALLPTIIAHAPAIVMVGLGFPFQEQWLATNLRRIPSARIGIGLGGTFDYWTGTAQRAPWWVRRVGCEWLWRVLHEPLRIGRIARAVVVFPLVVLKERFVGQKHTY